MLRRLVGSLANVALVLLVGVEGLVIAFALRTDGSIDFVGGDHSSGMTTSDALPVAFLLLVLTLAVLLAKLNWPRITRGLQRDIEELREARHWFQEHGSTR